MAELAVLAAVFVTAAAVMLLTDALPLPTEAVYILTGLAIGQVVTVPDGTVLAEVGAVLLIFFIAANMQLDVVRDVLPTAAWAVSAQAALLVAAASAALVAGMNVADALLLGMACSMSSSMLGVDIVSNEVDRRLLHGRLTEAVTVGQDIAAVLIVAALPFWPHPVAAVAAAAAAVAVLLAIGAQRWTRPLLARLKRDGATTLMLGLAVLWLTVAATAGHPYGAVLGAVLAGFLLGGHPEDLTLLETLEPVQEFFTALFFVVLGTLVAAPAVTALWLGAALVLVIAIVRPLLTMLVLHRRGVDLHAAFITAVQLDQMSEIVLLLGLLLAAGGLTTPAVFQAVVLAAAVSFIIDDYTTRNAARLYAFIHTHLGTERTPVDRSGHTIIAGYGGWGRAAADAVEDPVILDNDPDKVARATADGHTALLGDIHDHMAWHRAAVDTADAVVLTVPSDRVAARLVGMDAGFTFIAVTDTAEAAEQLRAQGAAYATHDTALASTAFRAALEQVLTAVLEDGDGD